MHTAFNSVGANGDPRRTITPCMHLLPMMTCTEVRAKGIVTISRNCVRVFYQASATLLKHACMISPVLLSMKFLPDVMPFEIPDTIYLPTTQ